MTQAWRFNGFRGRVHWADLNAGVCEARDIPHERHHARGRARAVRGLPLGTISIIARARSQGLRCVDKCGKALSAHLRLQSATR